MDFSLSSSLVGSAVSNPDKLALDLQFATDKSLAARKGPTPAFTRGSTGTFVGSNGLIQSAGNNVARFDHNPISPFACKGLLIEESRTNSITGSNAFNSWTMSNSTVAASSVSTPEGTADAWKVVEDLLLANHTITRSFTPVSGTTYTASVWLKSAENGFALIGLAGGGFATTFISANLSTGAVSTALGTPIGAASVAHSNGWWRVSFSLAATAALVSIIDIRLSRDGLWANRSYLGNGVNGMYCYGAQVEAGSFPTSYIPTGTTTLTRSGDVCTISSTAFSNMWSRFSGTVVIKATEAGNNGSRWLSTDAGQRTIDISGKTSITFFEGGGGTTTTIVTPITLPATVGLAYAVNDYQSAYNGLLGGSDTNTGATFPNPTFLDIGRLNTLQQLCGCISFICYYKKRLPNSKLQALTV